MAAFWNLCCKWKVWSKWHLSVIKMAFKSDQNGICQIKIAFKSDQNGIYCTFCLSLSQSLMWLPHVRVPVGSPSPGGDVTVCVRHKPTELAHSFLFSSCVYFCLYGPFNCISFHKFSRQLSAFQLCSSGLIFAWLVLSTLYLFMKVSLSPGIIHSGWLGSKHQLTI